MTYREAVERLYSLERWGIKLGLRNIRHFCAQLHHPQRAFQTVHIAGTNGKGSVAVLLDHMLRSAGLRVGRFTSPHLRDFRERIHIDGRPIPRRRVVDFMDRHWTTIYRERYSYFETATAMALDCFAASGVQVGVIEVGLGGRFDATNTLKPQLTVITHIDFDHERTLGHTLKQIAREKAGIIKPGTPVIIGPLPSRARDAIERVARRRSAPVLEAADILRSADLPERGQLERARWVLPLPGPHQITNLAVALSAALVLRTFDTDLHPDDLRRGVRQTHWPARFQVVRSAPVLVFDVAHNPAGMRVFARTWESVFGDRRAAVLFTTKHDKNYGAMWESLAPCAGVWVGTPLPHSRGIERTDMQDLARRSGIPFHWARSARSGYHLCRKLAGPKGICLVVGSHYLVGAVIPAPSMNLPSPNGGVHQILRWRDILNGLRTVETL